MQQSMQTMKKQKMNRLIKILLLSVLAMSGFACQPNQSILNSKRADSTTSTNSTNSATPEKDTFEKALRGVQKSGFEHIFVIRRKDGGKFDKEDKVFVKENSPAETNQFILTDEDRVVIAGSNYPFPEETVALLRKVFDVEDMSPPKSKDSNNNSNSNNNSKFNANSNLRTNVNSNK